MSQRKVYESLKSFEGGATRKQLLNHIEEEYPDRSLTEYLGVRLQKLIDKGVITSKKENGETVYYIQKEGFSPEYLGISIDDFDQGVDQGDLLSEGIEVENIVGSGTIGTTVDLQRLATNERNIEYEPETHPMAVWKLKDDCPITVLLPSSGNITIVGCKNKDEFLEAIKKVKDIVPKYCKGGGFENNLVAEVQIHNIVGSAELKQELDLSTVSLGLGLERAEYDPEQFPGIVFQSEPGAIILIYRTGKVVITGTNTYAGLLNGYRSLVSELIEMGIDIN